MDTGPKLSGECLDRVFPFHFALDGELRLTAIGSSLARLCPDLAPGQRWTDHFEVTRPVIDPEKASLEVLAERERSPFVLCNRSHDLTLRGQVLVDVDERTVLFLGMPWVTGVEGLKSSGVKISDFPLHTPLADLVFVIQNQQISLNDARELAARLRRNQSVLARAKQEAVAAAIAKDAFLANISHEIRTPLNGIAGMTRLLLESTLRPDQEEYAELIERSSSSLLSVLEDVIELAQIRSGRLVPNAAPFDLVELLEGVVAMYSGAARAKGVRLELGHGGSIPPTIVADAGRLRQILYNLVGNAVKFTERGVVRVEAVVDCAGEGSESLLGLRVTDTGVGIPRDSLDRIFEEFVQADDSATRRFGGSGLGLSICRRLVHLMSGTISAESVEGQGATFRIELPVRVVGPAARSLDVDGGVGPVALLRGDGATNGATGPPIEREEPVAPAPSRAPRRARPGARLLVVEDNAINQLVAKRLLSKLGYLVDCASNGLEAVAAVRSQTFDLVLMDLQMPEMDGFEATRRIRALDGPNARVPIVALTANALPEHRERCLADGMDDFVAKPFDFEALAETIALLVGTAGGQQRGSVGA